MLGKTLSHYKVLEKIGQGGMGVVYRAEDTNLSREVAIKVLPEQFTKDPQRLARFEREAKLLASLNHPNIAAIHSFEHSDDIHFLVLELVPGETLQERVAKGPLPVDEALEVCRQIAEGVEAAHEKGVIHRDLKPANVKVTPEGKVKILDFGLAKAFEAKTPVTDISQSPTLTEEMTRAGVILGTAAYMSPEQAKGKPVDKRADIFAFGAVLYELLTGKRAFEGETITETIAKVLESEPKWELLPENTPWTVRTLLRRCLTKDVHDRLDGIGNVRTEIKLALEEPATASPTGVGSSVQPVLWKRAIPWSLAGMMALIIGLMLWNQRLTTSISTPPPVVRSVVALPADVRIADLNEGALALSPDGIHLAYAASRGGATQLYLRTMDQLEARPIPGTESASYPFFSPDGQWLGFFADSKLKKVALSGGAPVILTEIPSPLAAASWGADDTIVVRAHTNSVLFQVSADGGSLEALTTRRNGESDHVSPQFLPDGKTVLFTVRSAGDSQIVVQPLETQERRVVLERAYGARYVPSGHLVYPQSGTLMAVAFDLEQLEVTGSPTPILEGVGESGNPSWFAHFAFSDTGTLVYVPTGSDPREGRILVWVDRKGAEQPLAAPSRAYSNPRLSPDGQRLAVTFADAVWIYDIQSDTLTRLTFEGNGNFPLWTPDGKRITFISTRLGPQDLFWKPADGTGAAEQLVVDALSKTPHSWSPDGKFLAYTELNPTSAGNIWVLPVDGEPEPFLQEPYVESGAVFSPDGHWIAYRSNESGRHEIYVQPFPKTGAKWQISTDGGGEAAWVQTRTVQEIFYRHGNKMMSVDVTTEPAFTSGKPKLLFEGEYAGFGFRAVYDVTADGERFLMIKNSEQQVTQINVVLNWFEELKRLVPTN